MLIIISKKTKMVESSAADSTPVVYVRESTIVEFKKVLKAHTSYNKELHQMSKLLTPATEQEF